MPEGSAIKEEFGAISYRNQKEEVKGEYNYSQLSVLYDVINKIVITAECGKAKAYEAMLRACREVELAIKHLKKVNKEEDLLLFDRNYATYEFMATLLDQRINFVIRCPVKYTLASKMQTGTGADSRVVEIEHKKKTLRVRFVRVLLSTGEYEILVTSLLNKQSYPTKIFKEIYGLRWGVETYYGLIKTRLELENFTGKTVESVLQAMLRACREDLYSKIYLTNLETILGNGRKS